MAKTKCLIRGRQLENQIERVFERLNAFPGIIALRLEVKRIANGVYKAKQPCDYLVITPRQVWMFDAKECSDDTWYLSRAPEHQREAFRKARSMGYRAGFLVQFTSHPLQIIKFVEDDKVVTPDIGGKNWDWQELMENVGLCPAKFWQIF